MTIILLPFSVFRSLHTREFCEVLNTQIRCTQDSKTEVVCSYYINVNEDSIQVHVIPYVIIVSFQMKGAKRSIKSNPPSFTVHSSQSRIIPQRETSCHQCISLKFYFSQRSYFSAALVSLSFNPPLTPDFLHPPTREGGWIWFARGV